MDSSTVVTACNVVLRYRCHDILLFLDDMNKCFLKANRETTTITCFLFFYSYTEEGMLEQIIYKGLAFNWLPAAVMIYCFLVDLGFKWLDY